MRTRHRSGRRFAGIPLFLGIAATAVQAEIALQDAAGNQVKLSRPATRIVSLAPHATELLFAAGAGDRVVGVVQYSDYPPAAKKLPIVGSGLDPDIEKIVALQPELIAGWQTGNSGSAIDRLRHLGFPVYLTEPRRLEDIAREIDRLGQLTNTGTTAHQASNAFRAQLSGLHEKYDGKRRQRVFYQLLDATLLTINNGHLISDALHLCSGVNVFGQVSPLVQRVEIESVIAADPDLIIAGGPAEIWESWLARWQSLSALRAVRAGQLYRVDADVLHRQSPRVIEGATRLCEIIDRSRDRP